MNRLQLSSGSFTAPVQHEKQEIHTVFLCFSYFPGKQNLPLSALADLIRASLKKNCHCEPARRLQWQSHYLEGKCIDNCLTGRGNIAIFGGNRELLPFIGGLSLKPAHLSRNDSINMQDNNLLFHVLQLFAKKTRRAVWGLAWFLFEEAYPVFSRRRLRVSSCIPFPADRAYHNSSSACASRCLRCRCW